MTDVLLAHAHSETVGATGNLARAFIRAYEALREINKYNRIHNDLEAYLFDLAEWGMGDEK